MTDGTEDGRRSQIYALAIDEHDTAGISVEVHPAAGSPQHITRGR